MQFFCFYLLIIITLKFISKYFSDISIHATLFHYWYDIDSFLSHNINIDGLLGINATVTTLFITLAFFLMDIKEDNPDTFFWDIKVIFNQLLKIKYLMFSLFLIVTPLVFWNIRIKLIILILYVIGILFIVHILINSYKWITSIEEKSRQIQTTFKNSLRKKYLISMNKFDPIPDVYSSLMNSKSITTINQLELPSLFQKKIVEIREKKDTMLYDQLWSVYLNSYIKEKDIDKNNKKVTLFDNPNYLENFFDTYFIELQFNIESSLKDKNVQNDLVFSLNAVISHTFNTKRSFYPVPIFQEYFFSLLKTLNVREIPKFICTHGMYFIRELIAFNKKNPDISQFNTSLPIEWTNNSNNIKNYLKTNLTPDEEKNKKIFQTFLTSTLDNINSISDRPLNSIIYEQVYNRKNIEMDAKTYRQALFEMFFPTSDPVFSGNLLSLLNDINYNFSINNEGEEEEVFWHSVILLGYRYNFYPNRQINYDNLNSSFNSFDKLVTDQMMYSTSEFIKILSYIPMYSKFLSSKSLLKVKSKIVNTDYSNLFKEQLLNSVQSGENLSVIEKKGEDQFDKSKKYLLILINVVLDELDNQKGASSNKK